MKPTRIEPVAFVSLPGEMTVVEWRPPSRGVLNGCTSGARIDPQTLAFRGEREPTVEVDGKLVPAFITMLCDTTWVLSIPSMVVDQSTLVRLRFVSRDAQQDGIEFIFGGDMSAGDWLREARRHAAGGVLHA